MAHPTFLASLKQYVAFEDGASSTLRAFHRHAAPHIAPIVDDFYEAIAAHPEASASITGGAEQIDRLKKTLVAWLDSLLLGPHDEAYFERRARIGRVHVRISLPQAFMFTAMNRIRVRLLDIAERDLLAEPERLRATTVALNQIMDIELAIMLETYSEDLTIKTNTAERLATLGQFACGIGHELRNPLGIIESSLFLLRQHLQRLGVDDPRVGKHLDKIAVELKRSNKTISDMLDLARNRPPRRQRISAKTIVAQAIAASNLPGEVTVDTHVPPEITVDADPDQIAQLLTNLLLNGSQAMGGRGQLHVTADRAGPETRLRVRDEGPGVPAEVRHRIFEALFTTKAKGTGLGLALCRRIAEAHGGSVSLEPSATGASFLVTIPDDPGAASGRGLPA